MSSTPAKAVSGLIRCKGVSKSSGKQCRHVQYDSQYCPVHKDQTDAPSGQHAAGLNWLGRVYAAISRPAILVLLGFLSKLWLTDLTQQILFSAPEYHGPVRVCAKPEPSFDIFNQHYPVTGHSAFPNWLNPFRQRYIYPVFEPASLVDHLINVTIPAAGAGAQNLTISQTKGLSMWQKCSKEKISSKFDLQCPFDAFNQLFFGGYLAQVKIGWTEPTNFSTALAERKAVGENIVFGRTYSIVAPGERQRPVNITLLSRESSLWHYSGSPSVHGALLHEMVHAYFALYACSGALVLPTTKDAAVSEIYPYLSNLGYTRHGPEWLRLIRALEKSASEYLDLGTIDLGWRFSVSQELLQVKAWRIWVAGYQQTKIGELDEYFGEVITDINALLGSMA